MVNQPAELRKNEELVTALSKMVPIFIKLYKASHGDTSINGMPRRMQLSSLTLRLLFQDANLAKEISAAFFNDLDIRKFFGVSEKTSANSDEALFGGDCCVLDNSGSGGTQQPISTIVNILLAAIDLCVLEKDEFNEDAIAANLHKMVTDFKTFVRGTQIEETHLIGFSGFITEEGTKIGFGELNAFPLSTFQSSYFFGREDGIGFVVKEAFCRKKLFVGTSAEMHKFVEKGSLLADIEFFTKMHLLIKNVRLALVLALSDEQNAFQSFIEGDYLITPTGNLNSFMQRDVVIGRRPAKLQLNQKSVNQLSIKYLSIVDADLSSIEIAVKRLLSAVCTRDNDDDALIDAVMCWENIIGSESEVTFRICASIAKLLAKDSTERSDIYGKLKNIYRARSSLVHGNSAYKTDSDITQQAIFYAICLLNAILRDNKLLQMTSAKRSEYIMLNMGTN